MNRKRVKAEAAYLPLKMGLLEEGPTGLEASIQSKEGLEQAFQKLTQELRGIAEATTPRRKANQGFSSPWWSEEVKEHKHQAGEAEREHQRALTAYTNDRLI